VAGPQLLRLFDEAQRAIGRRPRREHFLHLICAVADDNHYIYRHSGGGSANCVQDVRQHRPASNKVEYFRHGLCKRPAHPLTLSCSQYHDVHARFCTLIWDK
jgi:hypothetical protein